MKEKLIPYLTAEEIQALNRKLGKQITEDYRRILVEGEELLVVVTLKGASFFAADVLREIDLPLRMDFVRLASYGGGTKSSGQVRILKDIEERIEGKHVLVLDEIVDSGRTLRFLLERLSALSPKTLKLGALLNKPSRREVEVSVDYLGADVEDKFLVGYGLDYGEKYRQLKDICILDSGS